MRGADSSQWPAWMRHLWLGWEPRQGLPSIRVWGTQMLGWFGGVELMRDQPAARSGLDALVFRFREQLALLLLLRYIGLGLGLETDPVGKFPAVIGSNQIDTQAIERGEE
jgi:hypothetical protein